MKKSLKSKCLLVGMLIVAFTFPMLGCGSSKPSVTGDTATKKTVLRLGYIMAPGGPADDNAKFFKKLVEERSKGQIEVQVYPSSTLGNEADLMDGIKLGSVDMALTGEAPINLFAPEYAALNMPYAFRDLEHLQKVLSGPIGNGLADKFVETKGARVLDYWTRGPRFLTANREIKTPDDLKGLKLRVPEIKVFTEAWKAMGAIPTPINFGELYNAMQQHVVDAQENPLELITTSSFYEIQKYLMTTAHVRAPYILFISDKIMKGLPEDLQKVINDSAKEAGQQELKDTLNAEDKFLAGLKAKGMTVVEVDTNLFRDKIKDLPARLESELKWKPGLYQAILDTK
ncbi:MAG TPA: TRAP transporter substrate-binding protein [Desulfosporosinus sp.]|nr:TRAP transporter substrate-binding protein [Desulfosporosinus sp.]